MSIKKVQSFQKILAITMMVMMLISTVSTIVLAVDGDIPQPSTITADKGKVSSDTITSAGKQIVYILQTVGVVLSVVVLVVIGIKYMMGSAEEKAEYKKTLLPYIIGAALVFAASFIASVVFNFASSMQ